MDATRTNRAQLWAADYTDSELLSIGLSTFIDGFEWRSDVQLTPLGEVPSKGEAAGPWLMPRGDQQRRIAAADAPGSTLVRMATEFSRLGAGADAARMRRACEYANQYGWLGRRPLITTAWPSVCESWELWRSESSAAHEVVQVIRWAGKVRSTGDETSRRHLLNIAVVTGRASDILEADRWPRFGGLNMDMSSTPADTTRISLPGEDALDNEQLACHVDNAIAVWLEARLAHQLTASPYPRRELRWKPLNGLAAVHLGLALLLTRGESVGKICLHCRKPITTYVRSTRQYHDACQKPAYRRRTAKKRSAKKREADT